MNGFVPENRIISERGKINQTNGGIYHEEKNSSRDRKSTRLNSSHLA